mmetsp:Transcript_54499/g.118820  ORF Transcript_54499/g.118820 Transcript_54499/m.118820 type:complete len:581 (-) Transcript_54499:583-2325(-)
MGRCLRCGLCCKARGGVGWRGRCRMGWSVRCSPNGDGCRAEDDAVAETRRADDSELDVRVLGRSGGRGGGAGGDGDDRGVGGGAGAGVGLAWPARQLVEGGDGREAAERAVWIVQAPGLDKVFGRLPQWRKVDVEHELVGEQERHRRDRRLLRAQLLGPPDGGAELAVELRLVWRRHGAADVLRQDGERVLVPREEARVGGAVAPQLGEGARHLLLRPLKRSAAAAAKEQIASKGAGRRPADEVGHRASRVPRHIERVHRQPADAQLVAVAQRVRAAGDAVALAPVHGQAGAQRSLERLVATRVVPMVVSGEDRRRLQCGAAVLLDGEALQRSEHRSRLAGVDEGEGVRRRRRAVDDDVAIVVEETGHRVHAVLDHLLHCVAVTRVGARVVAAPKADTSHAALATPLLHPALSAPDARTCARSAAANIATASATTTTTTTTATATTAAGIPTASASSSSSRPMRTHAAAGAVDLAVALGADPHARAAARACLARRALALRLGAQRAVAVREQVDADRARVPILAQRQLAQQPKRHQMQRAETRRVHRAHHARHHHHQDQHADGLHDRCGEQPQQHCKQHH